ncbi:MAG: hypothetical protein ABIV43_03985 [Candidatus Saccharimonadales bacterium]
MKQKIANKLNTAKIGTGILKAKHYSFIIFLVVVASIYGFIMFRITTLSNIHPSEEAISSQVNAAKIPKIDERVVAQLKSLQDNSVNVKSLFDQTRSNPFQ